MWIRDLIEAVRAYLVELFAGFGGAVGNAAALDGSGSAAPAPTASPQAPPMRWDGMWEIEDFPPPEIGAVTDELEIPVPAVRTHPYDSRRATWTRDEIAMHINAASARWNVPAAILAGIARTESWFDPSARGGVGELGMMQIRPQVAAVLLEREGWGGYPSDRLHDVGLATYLAAKLLDELRRHLGLEAAAAQPQEHPHSALARVWRRQIHGYNLGEGAVRSGRRNEQYYGRVLGAMLDVVEARGLDVAALIPVERATT